MFNLTLICTKIRLHKFNVQFCIHLHIELYTMSKRLIFNFQFFFLFYLSSWCYRFWLALLICLLFLWIFCYHCQKISSYLNSWSSSYSIYFKIFSSMSVYLHFNIFNFIPIYFPIFLHFSFSLEIFASCCNSSRHLLTHFIIECYYLSQLNFFLHYLNIFCSYLYLFIPSFHKLHFLKV